MQPKLDRIDQSKTQDSGLWWIPQPMDHPGPHCASVKLNSMEARRFKMKLGQVDVLVVEDHADDAELTLRALHIHEPRLTTAVVTTGIAAIDYLQLHAPKAILLDLRLPDMDGFELLKHIREDSRLRSIPVIVLTGSSADRHRTEAHRLGVNAFINKTADLHGLADHFTIFKHLLFQTKKETL
jgi:two-component system response regulator